MVPAEVPELESAPQRNGKAAHVCDICGVNQSARGKLFMSAREVWQHKRKRHPAACEGQADQEAPAAVSSAVPVVQRRQKKSRRSAPPVSRRFPSVKFCPCCGFSLDVVHAAMEFVSAEPTL